MFTGFTLWPICPRWESTPEPVDWRIQGPTTRPSRHTCKKAIVIHLLSACTRLIISRSVIERYFISMFCRIHQESHGRPVGEIGVVCVYYQPGIRHWDRANETWQLNNVDKSIVAVKITSRLWEQRLLHIRGLLQTMFGCLSHFRAQQCWLDVSRPTIQFLGSSLSPNCQ